MNPDIKAVTDAINAIGSATGWQLVGTITAAGTISMAFLQLVKDFTPIRRGFQRRWMTAWIEEHADEFNKNRQRKDVDRKVLSEVSPDEAQALLIELATGGDDRAFYELAIEQMVAQMNAAVQITLDYPSKNFYFDLLAVMSDGADLGDVAAVVSHSPTGARGKKAAPPDDYLQARARVSHRIQRNLDAIQISVGKRWERWLHVASIVVSVILILAFFRFDPPGFAAGNKMAIGSLILFALLGGMVAPVASNLVAALKKAKGT